MVVFLTAYGHLTEGLTNGTDMNWYSDTTAKIS